MSLSSLPVLAAFFFFFFHKPKSNWDHLASLDHFSSNYRFNELTSRGRNNDVFADEPGG